MLAALDAAGLRPRLRRGRARDGADAAGDAGARDTGLRRRRARHAGARGAAPAGVALDLGGIGKGCAADEVSAELLAAGVPGVTGVLVNLGGDLRAAGRGAGAARLGGRGRRPARDRSHRAARVRRGRDRHEHASCAGRGRAASAPLHHLIDPRTGEPAESGLASVTVVAGEAWRAEVLAKAAFVAGPDDGAALDRRDAGATGLLVTDDGEVLELAGLDRASVRDLPSGDAASARTR